MMDLYAAAPNARYNTKAAHRPRIGINFGAPLAEAWRMVYSNRRHDAIFLRLSRW